MIDEIIKENLYNYPVLDDINFYYRGQCSKYNSVASTFSQLCRYVPENKGH